MQFELDERTLQAAQLGADLEAAKQAAAELQADLTSAQVHDCIELLRKTHAHLAHVLDERTLQAAQLGADPEATKQAAISLQADLTAAQVHNFAKTGHLCNTYAHLQPTNLLDEHAGSSAEQETRRAPSPKLQANLPAAQPHEMIVCQVHCVHDTAHDTKLTQAYQVASLHEHLHSNRPHHAALRMARLTSGPSK